MTYDLLIRNGRIVDGSGMPAFHGDVAVKDGKIAEIGKTQRSGDPHHRRRWTGGGARFHRQPLPLRRPGDLGSAVHVSRRTMAPPR